MTSASDAQTFEGIAVGLTAFVGGIFAVYHFIFRRGEKQSSDDNRITLLEDGLKNIVEEFDTFKKWAANEHSDMNEEVRKMFDKLEEKLIENASDLSEIKGYLKGKSENHS